MKKRLLGSFIVLIIALIPLSDNVINALSDDNFGLDFAKAYGFTNLYNFIWSVGASVSPILMFISSRLKPYYGTYFLLVFTYSADMFWILFTTEYNSYDLSYLYAILFTIGLFVSISIVKKVIKNEITRNNLIELLLNEKFNLNKKTKANNE